MQTFAWPATSLGSFIFAAAMVGSTAASYWIGPGHSSAVLDCREQDQD